MSLPKEIAEKVIKGKEYITSIDTEPRILARAYLELEKEKRQIQVKLDDILTKELNDNRDMQIRILESEITKLKKSREGLREAVDKILNGKFILDYGIIASEAIKADDELMEEN